MEDIKSISESKKMRIGEYLKATWYFEKFFEKAILVGLCLLGLVRIVQWVFW